LRRAAAAVLSSALEAADPYRLVRRALRVRAGILHAGRTRIRLGRGRVVLVAAGKAAAAMARAAEDALGHGLASGLLVTTHPADRLRRVQVRLAGHPLPDRRGLDAAAEVEALARGLEAQDLLLVLLSGGASALLPAPVPGLSLEDKAA